MNNICVLGSINMDLVISVNRIPIVGETIFGTNLLKSPGGKGANQAIAMKRLGQQVSFIGCVGKDEYGSDMLSLFKKEEMDINGISVDPSLPTGLAFIMVDAKGNNNITVISGSNQQTRRPEVQKSKHLIVEADQLVSQFEVPMEAILEAFSIAKSNHTLTILNPSPVTTISKELYSLTDFLILNEYEALALNGQEIHSTQDAIVSAKSLLTKGVPHILLTLGAEGVVYASKDACFHCPAEKVDAIDTTAAGDSFLGAFCSKLSSKDLSPDAMLKYIQFANQVSAIVVQRKGAQNSLPYLNELSI